MKYNKDYNIKNEKYDEIKKAMDSYQYDKALRLLKLFNQEYPGDIYGEFDYAKCLIKTNNIKQGIEKLEELKKGNIKKIAFKVYNMLLDNYSGRDEEKRDNLLIDAEKILDEFELGLFKVKYYYNRGLCKDAEDLLSKIKVSNEEDKSKTRTGKDYLRANRKRIEKELKQYLKKKYISVKIARSIYLKLYVACSDYEEAYKYIPSTYNSGIKPAIVCYEICTKLDKKEEAEKYLKIINSLINNYDISDLSILKAQVLYINGKREEAFELCRDIAVIDNDAAVKVYEYGIQIGKLDEIIEALEEVVENTPITSKKIIKIIKELCSTYISKQEYQKAYELYKKYESYMNNVEKKMYSVYFSNKLGLEDTTKIKEKEYILKQVKEYNYDAAFDRILKCLIRNKETYSELDKKLIEDFIKKTIPKLKQENLKEYEIVTSDLGIGENRMIVGTLEDTNNIIYCHPVKNSEYELEYEEEIEEKPKEKVYVKSGLDRFNEKYKTFFQKN